MHISQDQNIAVAGNDIVQWTGNNVCYSVNINLPTFVTYIDSTATSTELIQVSYNIPGIIRLCFFKNTIVFILTIILINLLLNMSLISKHM